MQRMMNALGALLVMWVGLSACSAAQTTCDPWNCDASVPWTMQSVIFNFSAPNLVNGVFIVFCSQCLRTYQVKTTEPHGASRANSVVLGTSKVLLCRLV